MLEYAVAPSILHTRESKCLSAEDDFLFLEPCFHLE